MERSICKNTKGGTMKTKNKKGHNFSTWIVAVGLTAMTAAGCAGGSLTTREKGAGMGALGGAPGGGVVGNTKGHTRGGRDCRQRQRSSRSWRGDRRCSRLGGRGTDRGLHARSRRRRVPVQPTV